MDQKNGIWVPNCQYYHDSRRKIKLQILSWRFLPQVNAQCYMPLKFVIRLKVYAQIMNFTRQSIQNFIMTPLLATPAHLHFSDRPQCYSVTSVAIDFKKITIHSKQVCCGPISSSFKEKKVISSPNYFYYY